MTASPLRIALIGAGLIGREHALLLAKNPATRLVAVADPADASVEMARSFGARHYRDLADMLDTEKPDGVIIASPNALHVDAGIACVERGIPCLVEKPVADNLEAAQRLVAAVERSKVPVLVGHQRRHSPDIARARRMVRDGDLGRLVAVNALWMTLKPAAYFDAAWRRQPGGGPLLINLIHDIDCLRFICGDVAEVMAITSNAVRGFEVEDTASVSLRFTSGALGTLLMSDTAISPYNWDTAAGQALYFPHQPENAYVLAGTKGALSIPSMDLWKHDSEDGSWQDPLIRRHVTLDGSRAYDNQLIHFVEMIEGRAEPLVSARDGMQTLATIEAIARSGRERRPVAVGEANGTVSI